MGAVVLEERTPGSTSRFAARTGVVATKLRKAEQLCLEAAGAAQPAAPFTPLVPLPPPPSRTTRDRSPASLGLSTRERQPSRSSPILGGRSLAARFLCALRNEGGGGLVSSVLEVWSASPPPGGKNPAPLPTRGRGVGANNLCRKRTSGTDSLAHAPGDVTLSACLPSDYASSSAQ